MIVPIAPVVSKIWDQQDYWHDWWFPYNRLDRLKDKSRTCFANKPNMMEGFNKRANLVVCYLLILSILWPNKVEMFHEDTASRSELDGRDYLFFTYCAYAVLTLIFVFLPDYWNKSDDFWGSFWSSQSTESVSLWSLQNLHDRPDLSRRSRSSQSSGSIAIVRVACLNIIWDDWNDHKETGLWWHHRYSV